MYYDECFIPDRDPRNLVQTDLITEALRVVDYNIRDIEEALVATTDPVAIVKYTRELLSYQEAAKYLIKRYNERRKKIKEKL